MPARPYTNNLSGSAGDGGIKGPIQRCKKCGQEFDNHPLLHKHKVLSHTLTTCHFCSKDFQTEGACKAHTLQNHAATQNLQCQVCGLGFSKLGGLVNHLEFDRCGDVGGLTFHQKFEERHQHYNNARNISQLHEFGQTSGDFAGEAENQARAPIARITRITTEDAARLRLDGAGESKPGSLAIQASNSPVFKTSVPILQPVSRPQSNIDLLSDDPIPTDDEMRADEDLICFDYDYRKNLADEILNAPLHMKTEDVKASAVSKAREAYMAKREASLRSDSRSVRSIDTPEPAKAKVDARRTPVSASFARAEAARNPPTARLVSESDFPPLWSQAKDNKSQPAAARKMSDVDRVVHETDFPPLSALPAKKNPHTAAILKVVDKSVKAANKTNCPTSSSQQKENESPTAPEVKNVDMSVAPSWSIWGNSKAPATKLFSGSPATVAPAAAAASPPVALMKSMTVQEPEGSKYSKHDPTDPAFNVKNYWVQVLDKYKCPIPRCMKKFEVAHQIIAHLKSNAHEAGRFRCRSCFRYFKTASALTQHSTDEGGVRCVVRQTDQYEICVDEFTASHAIVAGKNKDNTIRYAVIAQLGAGPAPAPKPKKKMQAVHDAANEALKEDRATYWKRNKPEW